MKLSFAFSFVIALGSLSNPASANGVTLDCFDNSPAAHSAEYFAADQRHPDPMSDPLVQQSLGRLGCLIQSRHFKRDGGIPDRISAEMLFYTRMEEWLKLNPDATLVEVRTKARGLVPDIAESPLMRPKGAQWHPVGVTELRPASDGSGSFLLRGGKVVGFLGADEAAEIACETIPTDEGALRSGFGCADEVAE